MVVGLGQGFILQRCRHSIGSILVAEMAAQRNLSWTLYPMLGAYVAHAHGRTILLWPFVQYNISGVVVWAAARRFGVSPDRITVLHDDLDVSVSRKTRDLLAASARAIVRARASVGRGGARPPEVALDVRQRRSLCVSNGVDWLPTPCCQ